MKFIALYLYKKGLLHIIILGFNLLFLNVNAASYTMGTSDSQSSTVSALISSLDTFYDNGGSGSNYSDNITDASYTFNCASGKYIRIRFNSIVLGAGDQLFIYDGSSVNDRLLHKSSFTGTAANAFICVATSGSLTVKFTSDGADNSTGWNADIWIDSYPGQIWNGTVSTDISTAENWEGDVAPYAGYTSVYIPSGLTNYPDLSNSSGNFDPFDVRIENGASFSYSATNTTSFLKTWGDFINDGTYNRTGTHMHYFIGGISGTPASLGGSGTFTNASFTIGNNTNTYYKLISTVTLKSIRFDTASSGEFDMNGFDLNITTNFIQSSTYAFYQRTGTLALECEDANLLMDNSAFQEGTGTTYFSSGTLNGAVAQTIPSITYYNLKVRTNNGITTYLGTTDFTVQNDFEIVKPGTAGGNLSSINNTGTSLDIKGDLYIGNTGNALTLTLNPIRIKNSENDGVIYMGNVAEHVINLSRHSSTAINFEGFGTPVFYGTVNYIRNGAQIVTAGMYQNLTLTGSGTKTMNGNLDVNRTLTISGTATFAAANTYDILLAGNWVNNGTAYTHANRSVSFDGTTTQTISGSTLTVFHDLEISNTAGDVTLSVDATVNGTLTLSTGDLIIAAGKTLTIDDTNDPGISGGSAASHVVTNETAMIQKTYTSTLPITFPLGDGTHYRPLSLTPSTNGNTIWNVGYTPSPHIDTDVETGSGLDFISTQEYWTCHRSGESPADAVMALTWISNSAVPIYEGVRIVHYDGTTDWDLLPSEPAGDNTSGTVTSSSFVSSFSPFTLGFITDPILLPIELTSFEGSKTGRNNTLNWVTSTEFNNDYFTLEKTTDGNLFEVIGTINGAGNSVQKNAYNFIDYDVKNELNYYRLKQTDFDGTSVYSNMILIDNRINAKKEIFRITTILGQELRNNTNGPVIIYYIDGSFIKTIL